METPQKVAQERDYDIALSFAGEDRSYVEEVANELKRSGVRVFYDQYEQASLWGKDLYTHLSDVYENRAHFTIMFISRHYANKLWTNHERKSAQARAFTERSEYILPVKFDETDVPGVLKTTGYIDLGTKAPVELARLAIEKLRLAGVLRASKSVGFSTEGTTLLEVEEPEGAVEFVSAFEPDDVTVELLYEELFRRSAKVVTIMPGRFSRPKGAEEVTRLQTEVTKDTIRVNWPNDILQLVRNVEELRRDVRHYRDKHSVFHGLDSSLARDVLLALNTRYASNQEFLMKIPNRIPWVWLALKDYYGPFSSGTSFESIKNYLRFASLNIYHSCASTLCYASRSLSIPPPAGTDLVPLNSMWQNSISVFFQGYYQDDEVVCGYVTEISGVRLSSEIVVYGPKSLATQAYAKSMDRKPIINPWFAHYLVPQVELMAAIEMPAEATSYSERAWIRKVTTLSGEDIQPDWPD